MSTEAINVALAARYPFGKYVNVWECPSCNLGGRSCDLITFGTWGSTKNIVIGHEVKASRSDWLKELQQPEKSDAFLPYVSVWYIVAVKGIVKLEELRSDWGLMELAGKSLKIRRQATAKTPAPMPANMLASMIRRAAQASERQRAAETRLAIESARQNWELGRERADERLATELARLKEDVARFEQESGLRVHSYGGREIATAIQLLRHRSPDVLHKSYDSIVIAARRLVEEAESIQRAMVDAGTTASMQNLREVARQTA